MMGPPTHEAWRDRGQLWEWTAIDKHGRTGTFQTREIAGIASEAAMLEHLRSHFHGSTIVALRRVPCREHKPPIGPVHRHTIQRGYWDEAMKELGHAPERRRSTLTKSAVALRAFSGGWTELKGKALPGLAANNPIVPRRPYIPGSSVLLNRRSLIST